MVLSKNYLMIVLLGQAFSFYGCMDIRAVDKKKLKSDSGAQVYAGQSVTSQIVPLPEFNKYKVIFKGLEGRSVKIERFSEKNFVVSDPARANQSAAEISLQTDPEAEFVTEKPESQSLNLGVSHGEAEDHLVEGGMTYTYKIYSKPEGDAPMEIKIATPKDLKIEGEVNPTTEIGKILFQMDSLERPCGRLFFEKKSTITTQGKDLILNCLEMNFDETKIQTFMPGSIASSPKERVDGGLVFLLANIASGKIEVDVSGKEGAKGQSGEAPGAELQGTKGTKGEPAAFGVNICSGAGCPQYQCLKQPTPGGPGGKGSPGYKGYPGYAGGNSAELKTSFAMKKNFELIFYGEPGRGGKGGDGGKGGAGGEGGEPGNSLVDGQGAANCLRRKGPQGPEGDWGPQGDWGEGGKRRAILDFNGSEWVELRPADMN